MKSLFHLPLAAFALLAIVFFSSLASGAGGVGAAGTAASDSVTWDIYAGGVKIGRTTAHRHEDNTWHWKAYDTTGKKTDEGTAEPIGAPGNYKWEGDKKGGSGTFNTGDGRIGSWTENGGQSGSATNRH